MASLCLTVAHVAQPRVSETHDMADQTPDLTPDSPVDAEEPVPTRPSTRPNVDEMGEASFPASDPPAVWTWDPSPRPGERG